MLLKIVCLYVAVVCVFAAPPTDVLPLEKRQPTVIPIVEQSEELEPNGTFKFSYETGNGIKREEISYDKVLPRTRSAVDGTDNEEENDENNEIHVQQGSYSYTAPDGNIITVRYIADENGFRPIGDHLPKPPSILIAASSTRISGRRAKTDDNIEGGSAPAAAIAAVPEALDVNSELSSAQVPHSVITDSQDNPIAPEAPAPKLESRIGELSSAVQATTSLSEISQESSTTPEALSTTEITSTTEPSISTTESALTTTEQLLSSTIASTEQPTTSETVTTSEPSSDTSTSEEPAILNTTPAESIKVQN